jgi:hypothetical protein
MASKIKVDTLETANGSGTIALSNQLSGMTGASMPSGSVIQVVNFQTGNAVTTTATRGLNDSIPDSGEGAEFFTLAITPTSATSKLKIDVHFQGHHSASAVCVVWLHQDSGSYAIAAGKTETSADTDRCISFSHYMTAGTTNATTFKVRGGGNNAGTFAMNGRPSRVYGGKLSSSITITEIQG